MVACQEPVGDHVSCGIRGVNCVRHYGVLIKVTAPVPLLEAAEFPVHFRLIQDHPGQVLARYRHIEDIPGDPGDWDVLVRGSRGLSKILTEYADEARLYKDLATLRTDVPLDASVELLEWTGVVEKDYLALCEELAFTRLTDLPHRWAPA